MKVSVYLTAVLCAALSAGCAGDANGPSAGNTELNLDIIDPGGTSGELGFTIDRVDYRITCAGNPTGTYPIPAADTTGTDYAYDDSVDFSGAFEIIDTRVPPVWQAVMDLPSGDCTITLSVYEDDEVVCVGSQTLEILEDAITKYDIVLVCSLSIDLPDGMADVDGTFEFITGNLCPKLYVLNAIPSRADPVINTIEVQYRAKDPDNACGSNCDPQSCTDDNPPVCFPYPSNINDSFCNPALGGDPNDPNCLSGERAGLVCTLVAVPLATGVPGGTFLSPSDGVTPVGPVLPVNLNTASGVAGIVLPGLGGPAGTNAASSPAYPPLPNTNGSLPPLIYQCDGQSGGGPVSMVVTCSDGDLECDQQKQITVQCSFGPDWCIGDPIDCSGSSECLTDGLCNDFCDPALADLGLCDRCVGKDLPVADGTPCGTDGSCAAGVCQERAWGTPQLVENNSEFAGDPQIAVDSSGNAIVVWRDHDGSAFSIWSNRYVSGAGWGTPERIDTAGSGDSDQPDVAVDAGGNATAVWRRADGAGRHIWSNRYVPGVGWGTAERLSTDDVGISSAAQVAADPSGPAIAVWSQQAAGLTALDYYVWSSRYEPGGGWGAPELIGLDLDAGVTSASSDPRVATGPAGDAVVVWAHRYVGPGFRYRVLSTRFTTGGGWGAVDRIDTNGSHGEGVPQVGVDSTGSAVVVWEELDSSAGAASGVQTIWSNRYASGTGWGTAERIEAFDTLSDEAAFEPQVAVDPSGNATSVWYAREGPVGTPLTIWANRYASGTGWGTAERISGSDLSHQFDPRVAVDPSGTVMAVWTRDDYFSIGWNRFTPAAGWGGPQDTLTVDTGTYGGPEVGVDAIGNAIMVWYQSDGTRFNVWANRYE